MKNPFKDFLYFSRGERRGILVLIIGIVLIFLSGYIYSFRQNSRQLSEEESRIQAAALKEYDNFIGSVREQEKNENSRFKKSERYKKRTVVLAPFDPNRTDSVTFCRLGLPAWMAKNILRYRSKGGKFRKAEDFKKVYGLTEEQYQTIIRKSKFPQNPKRSVRFSGKRTKRSVQKRKARNTQKAETKVL